MRLLFFTPTAASPQGEARAESLGQREPVLARSKKRIPKSISAVSADWTSIQRRALLGRLRTLHSLRSFGFGVKKPSHSLTPFARPGFFLFSLLYGRTDTKHCEAEFSRVRGEFYGC